MQVITAFLRPMSVRQEKAYACHSIKRAVSEAVKKWLTGRT